MMAAAAAAAAAATFYNTQHVHNCGKQKFDKS
jgi:hypothetical protein